MVDVQKLRSQNHGESSFLSLLRLFWLGAALPGGLLLYPGESTTHRTFAAHVRFAGLSSQTGWGKTTTVLSLLTSNMKNLLGKQIEIIYISVLKSVGACDFIEIVSNEWL